MLTIKDASWVYVLGSRPLYQNDGDYFDWLYLAMRWLPNLRVNDVAVLPDHWAMRDFVEFLQKTLLGFTPQIIWVPVRYLLDDAILESAESVIPELQILADSGAVFVPYDGTIPEFRTWFSLLEGAEVLGESSEWGRLYATKEWLHPWANKPDVPSLGQELGLPLLSGFNALDVDELMVAWQILGGIPAIIKPLRSSFGDGLQVVNSRVELENYVFHHGPVALEQYVQIDQDDFGEVSWSTHYFSGELFGPPTRQLVEGMVSKGNITPAVLPASVLAGLEVVTSNVVKALSPLGIGGLNGPFVEGKPYLTDPNVGRITGVCPSLLFRELYCPRTVTLNKKLGKPHMSVEAAWELLRSSGLAFDRSQQCGVAIQGWIPSAWSQIICVATSADDAIALYKEAERILVGE